MFPDAHKFADEIGGLARHKYSICISIVNKNKQKKSV